LADSSANNVAITEKPSEVTEIPEILETESTNTETTELVIQGIPETEVPYSEVESRVLAEDEIAFFTEYIQRREILPFLLSSYSAPEEIDLNRLFYDGIADGSDTSLTDEERNAYRENCEEIYTSDIFPIRRISAEEYLQKHLGIGLSQINKQLNWFYLSEYDTYYNQHGDTHLQYFTCTDGWLEGELIYLECTRGTSLDNLDTTLSTVVCLRKAGDDYLFVSNQLSEENYSETNIVPNE